MAVHGGGPGVPPRVGAGELIAIAIDRPGSGAGHFIGGREHPVQRGIIGPV